MNARGFSLVAAALGGMLWQPGAAPPPGNTFVLTQAFCLPPQATAPGACREQSVPVGATLEIQLPGTPSVWTIISAPAALRHGSTKKLRSPGRIAGTSAIYVFRFHAANAGQGQIVFREAPAHIAQPGGSFTFPIVVTGKGG